MEELVEVLNRIADAMSGNSLPLWASIAGLVAPVILTCVTIWLTVRLDRKNSELQKALSNRDMQNQTRQCVLDIYNAYFEALDVAFQAGDNVAEVFISDQSYYNWALSVENAMRGINRSYNQVKLMVEDEELLGVLTEARNSFSDINGTVKSYLNTGIPAQTIQNAWAQFSPVHGVPPGNYYVLMQNRALGEAFIKLCQTSYTDDIQKKLENYITFMESGKFDTPFKKYVQIKPMN